MALKYIYEKEGDVPEASKALYVLKKEFEFANGEKKDAWVLDVDDVVMKARHAEFREANRSLTAENKQLKEKFAEIDDADRARALLKVAKGVELDEAEKYLKKGGVDAMIEERTKTVKSDMEKKLNDANAKAVAAQASLDKERIENAILTACRSLSLQPSAEIAILRLADGVWTHKEGKIFAPDQNGNPRVSKDGTANLTIPEWLTDDLLAKHKYLLKESTGGGAGGSGSGAGDTGNVNPWKKETYNLTKQALMTSKEPEKAARMRAAAGLA